MGDVAVVLVLLCIQIKIKGNIKEIEKIKSFVVSFLRDHHIRVRWHPSWLFDLFDDACHAAIGKSVGTDGGFSRRFIFRRPLQPAAVFDTSIFLFRAPHLSLCRYGLLSPGHEHLPCASTFFLYFDFLNI